MVKCSFFSFFNIYGRKQGQKYEGEKIPFILDVCTCKGKSNICSFFMNLSFKLVSEMINKNFDILKEIRSLDTFVTLPDQLYWVTFAPQCTFNSPPTNGRIIIARKTRLAMHCTNPFVKPSNPRPVHCQCISLFNSITF